MPTENRSSNTELISQAASAIEDLLVNGTGTIAARAWANLPAELRAVAASPAPQPHPEPIAWMVGTAFWWTKEEAERDAAESGLPIVALGPMTDRSEVDQLSQVIRNLNDERDELGAAVGRMRAQLAEQDALLHEIRGQSGSSWLRGETQHKLDAALSASAEPSAPVDIDERAEFEEASEPDGANLDRSSDGYYVNPYVQSSWEGWSMRAALERRL